jgi:hypothetical protein
VKLVTKALFSRLSLGLAVGAALIVCVPAHASITYTCDASITALVSCSTLNTTLNAIYGAAFTDASANIYIAVNTNSHVSLGESETARGAVSYANYEAGLVSFDPSDPGLAAGGSLPGTNPYGTGLVVVTNALAYALHFATPSEVDGVTYDAADNSGNIISNAATNPTLGLVSCGPGVSSSTQTSPDTNCYDAFILVNGTASDLWFRSGSQTSGQFDFYSVVEHETDEVLGTASCLQNGTGDNDCVSPLAQPGANPNVSAADLFRYVCGSSTRSFIDTGSACFSLNNGTTDLKTYNNTTNGEDFGDWSSSCANVQDASACADGATGFAGDQHNIASNAEIALLNGVGFSLQNATPEPSTFALVGTALLGAGFLRRRLQARKNG